MALNQVEIIIVGGGMVGLTVARAMANTGLKILVLDTSPWTTPKAGSKPDLRVSAITRASQNIFRNLGCWQQIAALGISPYDKMHVWDATGKGSISFDTADLAEPDLGHIIENSKIRAGLWQSLQDFDNVTLLAPVRAKQLSWSENKRCISLDDGSRWQGKLFIAADGAHSWLRQQRQIQLIEKPYLHDALVCNINTELPHQQCARQRFLSTGPLALLPMKDHHQCSIVWSTNHQHAEALKTMSEADFNRQLTAAFENRLGALTLNSERLSFPLVRRHVSQYVDDGIALVGDAAHTIHPLAGQGVNLGLLDAASLAEVLIKAVKNNQDIGNRKVLRPYERWRRSENQLMLDAMGFFRQLFDGQQTTKTWLRNTGMQTVDVMPVLKRQIIMHAMGLKGNLPLLSKTSRDPAIDGDDFYLQSDILP